MVAHHDTWLDRPVALKRVRAGDAHALRREFTALRAVRHPALVAALDLVVGDDGSATLVEALVEGEALTAWARWQNPRQILAALAPVAHALAHLHTRGFAHGDISPNNILIDPAGRALLIDLGFAARRGTGGKSVAGTAGYIAPERLAKETAIDGTADIWSFGAVLRTAFIGERDGALEQITPDTVRALVEDCLRAAPSSRPSAMEIAGRMAALSERTLPVLSRPLPELPVVGRGRDVERLDETLERVRAPVWICGPRGVGKTSVLGCVLDGRRRAGDRVIEVSAAEPSAEDSLIERLVALADSEWPETIALRFQKQSAVERAQTLLLLVDRLVEPIVVAIDDAEDPPAFFGELLSLWTRRTVKTGPRVLVAARGELGPRDGVELAPFDLAGVETLIRTAFAEDRPATAAAAFDLAGGMPAGVLKLRGRHRLDGHAMFRRDTQELHH
ncbi:MAG: protein kinase, partial [Myxococcota bacterium]